MHKNTRLLPRQREKIYLRWQAGEKITHLADYYDVSRETIYKWIRRARLNEFSNRLSVNHRYRSIEYGLKKLAKTEKMVARRLARLSERYEKDYPGEMVHFDNAKLPAIEGDPNKKREHLHVAVDDFSRYLVADILPDKTRWSAAIHLEEAVLAMPFEIESVYSDNGKEYKGREDHQFVVIARDYNLRHKFTKPYTPKTNEKAERVIRTLLHEWYQRNSFTSREERKQSLDRFVRYYNQERPHQGLGGQTPQQRLDSYVP